MKKDLVKEGTSEERLSRVKKIAEDSIKTGNKRRSPMTATFYTTIAGLDSSDVNNMNMTKSVIQQIESKLG